MLTSLQQRGTLSPPTPHPLLTLKYFYNQPTGSSENCSKSQNEEPLAGQTFHAEKRAHFAAGSQTKSSCKLIPGMENIFFLASGLWYEDETLRSVYHLICSDEKTILPTELNFIRVISSKLATRNGSLLTDAL